MEGIFQNARPCTLLRHMPPPSKNITILTTNVRIPPNLKIDFADWQAQFNSVIAAFPGFVSLEISAQSTPTEWLIVQRFYNAESVRAWRNSQEHKDLIEKLKILIPDMDSDAVQEIELEASNLQGGVTEVFVTEVNPEMDRTYREWIAKIHQAEAKFPGFRGVYVQSPSTGKSKNWITLLQFDTPENLDRWLSSPERQEVLNESKTLIASLESHRVISPYAGWFSSIAQMGELPPVWKQTMIVLLVLFPIVMLEIRFLNPLLTGLNSALATFIGNAISVTLISWPMVPIAIWFLGWWLTPKSNKRSKTIVGTFLVVVLYLIEIALLWNLL